MLFQWDRGGERSRMSGEFIRGALGEVLAFIGLTDSNGQPLIFAPHDFRRLFITDGPIEIRVAEEVVGLVLQTSGEVTHPLDDERVALLVEPTGDSTIGAGNRRGGTRHGQTAFEVVNESAAPRIGQVQNGVDDVTDMPDPIVVRAVIHEQP